MVEFALSATILMLIFLGTFQFGYAFYQYNTLANAVRGAARGWSAKHATTDATLRFVRAPFARFGLVSAPPTSRIQ